MSFNAIGQSRRLLALMFTDIVGSTQLKVTLGTPEYSERLRRHNEIFESQMREFGPGAETIKHTGDGYFARFDAPSDAVRFALMFQHRMRSEDWGGGPPFATRIGIHLGQVELVEQAGRSDVVGLAPDLTARLMSLADGGQILLTRPAFDDARQYVRENPAKVSASTAGVAAGAAPLRWLAHGPYLFDGAPDAMDVFEVGAEGISPLAPPAGGGKGKRIVRHDEEAVLGWRPSIGDRIPSKPNFILSRKLGEGGFGEVWLARQEKLKNERVFKFCFNASRLRSLKREYVLFRLMKETLGDRPDIAQLCDYNLDSPPFYLESEHTVGGNLNEWVARKGGLNHVSLEQRLVLVADIATAVGAAHSVGILHKDVKPSNIFIHEERDGTVRPQLADFGIGFIADRAQLRQHNITETGFTHITEMEHGGNSRTGTRLYAAPEAAIHSPFTTHGDVFALGVLLYQIVIADLGRPFAAEWREDVQDELLVDDIAAATARTPTNRISAETLAERLRTLESRRAERLREREAAAALVVAGQQRADAERLRAEAQRKADVAREVVTFLTGMFQAASPTAAQGRMVTAIEVVERGVKDLESQLDTQDTVKAALEVALANVLHALGRAGEAEPLFRDALARRRRALGDDHTDTLDSLTAMAWALESLGRSKEAEPFYREAMERSPRVRGEDHPETITTINNFAGVLTGLGRAREAVKLLRIGVYRLERVLGPDHPDVLIAYGNYAIVLARLGKRRAAEPLQRHALERARGALGLDHPETLRFLSDYAILLHSLGRSQEAATLQAEGIERKRRVLGHDHPQTLNSLHAYANMVLALGCLDEAQPLHEEVLERRRKVLGAEHPATIRSMIANSSTLRALGRLAEAHALSAGALECYRRLLGEEHPDTISALEGHANVVHAQGRFEEAIDLAHEAVARASEHPSMGSRHPTTIRCARTLADALSSAGRHDDAQTLRSRFRI